MEKINLEGKKALVTGGSRGIGFEVAAKLIDAGAKVAISASTKESAKKATEKFNASGRQVIALHGDLSQQSEATRVVDEALEQLLGIDFLINNAGITKDTLLLRMSDDQWEKVIDTNLNGVFYVTRQVVKHMLKQRFGRIVSISSVVGFSGNAGQTNYSATKSALIGFTKSLAKEVASRNITCNLIAPGFIETDMTKKLAPSIKDAILKNIPAGRLGQASDIACGALYLCSNMSDYVTGTTIHINGGLY